MTVFAVVVVLSVGRILRVAALEEKGSLLWYFSSCRDGQMGKVFWGGERRLV